ncbi:hypothetical protein PybrP1_000663 [[Pythium] brassicae (nom. inval.)]|nr:hypothetical protein PybrP1_000663 [[Pythium] brassicae (nom. inval.)]
MVRRAKESSIALVDHAHTLDGPVAWQYTGKFRGIQMYRGEGGAASDAGGGMEYLCGVTTMAGSLAEVAAYFDQSTTERMRAKKAADALDCAVLYAIDDGGAANPFYRVAVKYASFEGPSTFSRARDYVFLECQDTFRHASGRRGWVLSMHSIKLPHCPEMEGAVRGSMYHSGFVFVEAERAGFMDVMHSLQINFRATKRLPSFMLNSALKRRITSVIQISRALQMARMGAQPLLRKDELEPKHARSLCANCARKFTLFIRKTRCRLCGQVVCQSCAPQVDWADTAAAKRDAAGATDARRKTRICLKCYRTGGALLPAAASTTSASASVAKTSAEYSDDEDLLDHAEHEHAQAQAQRHGQGHAGQGTGQTHDDDDDDDEAAAAADGLEEQTEESVFASSRFTRTADSLFSFSSEFHIHDLGASKMGGVGGGGLNSGARGGLGAGIPPLHVHEDATFDADMSSFFDTTRHLTPEDTDEELDKRARRYHPDFRGSASLATTPPPPPPPMTTQLSAGALKEHNKRFPGAKKQYQAPAPALAHQGSDKLVSIKDIRSNFMKGTVKGELPTPPPPPPPVSAASPARDAHFDDDYISRPPSAILSRVRANRSRTIQFAPEGGYRSTEMMRATQDEHAARMAELNGATAHYNASSRVAEPETNPADDEPFTLEHLESPAQRSEPPALDAASAPGSSQLSSSLAVWEAEQDAEEYYAPVSALELSQVRANRSHTIEFIPQFVATDEHRSIHDDDSDSDSDLEPAMLLPAATSVLTPSQRHSADSAPRRSAEAAAVRRSSPRRSAEPAAVRLLSPRASAHEADAMRVTEQYAGLQIPSGEVVEMASSPVAHHAAGADSFDDIDDIDDDDEQATRFSQTLIPILDLTLAGRGSETQSESGLSMLAESRNFNDIPLLDRRSTAGSVRESDLDLELLSRPTTVLMEQASAHRAQRAVAADDGDGDGDGDGDVEYDRSTEIMKDIEAEHRRRMAELNRIAVDVTGNRISRLHLVDEDRESIDTVDFERMSASFRQSSLPPPSLRRLAEQESDDGDDDDDTNNSSRVAAVRASEDAPPFADSGRVSHRASAARASSPKAFRGQSLRMSSLEFMPENEPAPSPSAPTPAAVFKPAALRRSTNLAFSLDLLEPYEPNGTRASTASTAVDEELAGLRRARAPPLPSPSQGAAVADDLGFSESQFRSTTIMQDKERVHRQRMAELNRIALENVGERLSTFELRESEDGGGFAATDRSLLHQANTAHVGTEWRATVAMDRIHSAHDAEMQALRDRVRELDDQCRASMASIFSPDELDFAELDAATEQAQQQQQAAGPTPMPTAGPQTKYKHREVAAKGDENSSRIANLYSVKNLRPVAARRNPVMMHERVSSATLYEQIAQLTELQSQVALAKDSEDEEAFKKRIKEQYKLLRTLKLRGY